MNIKNKTILITGGAGMIGSNLANYLTDENRVIVLDDLSSGRVSNLKNHNNISFIYGTITDLKVLNYIFSENSIDIVFHFAAHFANQNSIDHPQDDLMTNGMGTLNLLEMVKVYDVDSFCYASTSCIQGTIESVSGGVGQLDTPYAIHKLLGEYYVNFYYENYNIKVFTVRFFNVYGPYEYPGMYRNVIPNFISLALAGQDLTITGTGKESRSFTYVKDVIHILDNLVSDNAHAGRNINIGNSIETEIKVLADLIIDLTGSNSKISYTAKRKWDMIDKRSANISQLESLIPEINFTKLRDGIQDTIKWFIKDSVS